MKLVCTKENLQNGLARSIRVVSSSNTLPVLSNVFLKTENGLLTISSTNLEVSMVTQVRCKIEENGESAVQAKTLFELVNALPNENVTLVQKEGVLEVSAGGYQAEVKTSPPEDFPQVPLVENGVVVSFEPGEFKRAVESVVFAASSNETQPELCVVNLKIEENGTVFAATDRYRLAEKKIPVGSSEEISVIVPLKVSIEVVKMLQSSQGQLTLVIDENQLLFDLGDTKVISRIVDGKYPEYEQIIPEKFLTTVKLEKQEFAGALKASSVFTHNTNTVKMDVLPEGLVTVSSGAQDSGSGTVNIKAGVEGSPQSIIFNHRYILDMLNASKAREIEIKLNSDSLPVVFREVGEKDYLYLVMPIKN